MQGHNQQLTLNNPHPWKAGMLVYMPSGGRWPRICGCTSA